MTAKEQGLPEAVAWLCVSPDGFQRDATTSVHARDTYARAGRIITPLAALASNTGERGVRQGAVTYSLNWTPSGENCLLPGYAVEQMIAYGDARVAAFKKEIGHE